MEINKINIFIFNMLENSSCVDNWPKRIYEDFSSANLKINEKNLIKIYGNNKVTHKKIKIIKNMDTSYLSIYAANLFMSSKIIKEKLLIHSNELNDFYCNTLSELKEKYNLNITHARKLKELIDWYLIYKTQQENKKPFLDFQINNIFNNIDKETTNINFDVWLNLNKNNDKYKILFLYLSGKSTNEIAILENVSLERIRQILQKIALDIYEDKSLIFDETEKYKKIAQSYKFSKDEADVLNLNYNFYTFFRIFVKREGSKNSKDYIYDNNLIYDEKLAKKIASLNNEFFVDKKFQKLKFSDAFILFSKKNSLKYFNLKEIWPDFVKWCDKYNIDYKTKEIDEYVMSEKNRLIIGHLSRMENLISLGNHEYKFYDFENYPSNDFKKMLLEYLTNIDSIVNIEHFYINNEDFCNQNDIYNEKELFMVIKKLYSIKFKNILDFRRNPTIKKINFNMKDFIYKKVENFPNFTINRFRKYLDQNYSLGKFSYWNNICKFVKEAANFYKLKDLSSEEQIIMSECEKIVKEIVIDFQKEYLFKRDYFEEKYLKNITGEYREYLLSNSFMNNFGITITKYYVYLSKYESVLKAIAQWINNQENFMIRNFNYKIDPIHLKNVLLSSNPSIKKIFLLSDDNNTIFNVSKIKEKMNFEPLVEKVINQIEEEKIINFYSFLNKNNLIENSYEKECFNFLNSIHSDLFLYLIKANSIIKEIRSNDVDGKFSLIYKSKNYFFISNLIEQSLYEILNQNLNTSVQAKELEIYILKNYNFEFNIHPSYYFKNEKWNYDKENDLFYLK
ncbi:hypothetical protein [Mycoplasmopsis lipofaciens]|uniref:hypothetical protein n=1 Tax=Mycoplasmopsis lipofaciens TaxID=114884 RepID=UPI0004804F43|nr:hypothetical protein [Mycoplasmopsis lipofaciens]